jgi:hypothetical protein
MTIRTAGIAIGVAGALALAATTPTLAAPVTNAAGVKAAVSSPVTEVRWHHGFWPGAAAAGLALGFAAAAASPYYYDPGPYYYAPYGYAYDYDYAPYGYAYSWGPGYGWRHRHRWHHW